MFNQSRLAQAFVFVLVVASLIFSCPVHAQELQLPSESRAKLDSFEGHAIDQADKVFNTKDYRAAYAEYDAFINDNTKSTVMAYALYRRARCLQLDMKRFDAIKQYTDLLDYYANDIYYAAPALYEIGKMQADNGDMDQAVTTWAKMADDKDYSKHPLAASAVNRLAAQMVKGQNFPKAIQYYKQVAVDFRTSNPGAANEAIASAQPYFIRIKPDEAGFRDFYVTVKGFDAPTKVPDDKWQDRRYWDWVRACINQQAGLIPDKSPEKDKFYQYWAGVMDGHFPKQDDYQMDVINYKLAYEHDLNKWVSRMDDLFKANQTDGDSSRIINWMRALAQNGVAKPKIEEYFGKLQFDKMNNDQITSLLWVTYDQIHDVKLAKNVYLKINQTKLTDAQREQLSYNLVRRDPTLFPEVCAHFDNVDFGKLVLLRSYHSAQDVKKGLEAADQLLSHPDYTKEAYYKKGDMLFWSAKWDEAASAYRSSDLPPGSIFQVAECYIHAGKYEQAIGTFREVENFFPPHAPNAALRIAYVIRDQMHNKEKAYFALKHVTKAYPKSSESSTAIVAMQELGYGPNGPAVNDVKEEK